MTYGVWIRGHGWLRTVKGVVAFTDIEVAQDTARRIGGEARYIDDALADIEQSILQIEAQQDAQKWWQRLKIWSK